MELNFKERDSMWNLTRYEGNAAIIDEFGNQINYKELNEKSSALFQNINKRCLIFSLCKNEIGSIVGYVSFIQNRVVPVLLNATLEKELLENLISNYQPSYLWVPEEQKNSFKNTKIVFECYNYTLLQTNFDVEYPLHDDLCLLLTTSGSTGSPKFVRQSYVNVKANAESIVEYLELDEKERAITTLPMNYTYGLSIINSHLMVGATLLVTDKGLMQKEFWNFFREQEATSFGGVPYTYEMLDRLRFYRMNLPSLRYMTQAGGKVTPELHEKFARYAQENNKKFIVMYGQCEATARMGYLPPDKAVEKCGSMGIAIPGGRFSLIDSEENEIREPYVTGELIYEGPNVTLGYAECGTDLIKGDERNGVLQTGDMAQFDEDGYYYIVGRKKRFLKIYGNRVNLDEVDRLIKGKFDNIDCASTGIDDHMYIFVTKESLADSVKEFVVQKTRLNPVAFKTVVIEEIPKNDSGKVRYQELQKYYQ